MGRLDGKVVVILGASDARSMGAATAERFAAEGAKLVLAARRLDQLKPIAEKCKGSPLPATSRRRLTSRRSRRRPLRNTACWTWQSFMPA